MSVLFDVNNAITGTKAEPASHNMPPLCRFVLSFVANRADNATRLYSFGCEPIERDTGLCAATVRKCFRELVGRGWLIPRGWSGPRNNAVRVYEVAAEGIAWPPSEHQARETPTARRKRLAAPPDGVPESAPLSDGAPGRDRIAPRAVTASRPAAPPDGDLPLRSPPDLPPKEPPIAHAREHTRADRPAQMGIPFVATEDVQTTVTPKAAEPPPKPKPADKATRKPTAAEGYADAFVQAFADHGRSVSRPTTNEITLLGKLCRDHAKSREGLALTGEALPVWIRAQVRAMLDDVEDPSRHKGGVSVLGLRTWLDNRGGPVRVRELEPAPPATPQAPPTPPRLPPNVSDEVTLDGLLRLPPCPGTDEAIRNVRARIAAKRATQPEAVNA